MNSRTAPMNHPSPAEKFATNRSDYIIRTVEAMKAYPGDEESFAAIVDESVKLGLKPHQLANEFEVSVSTISRWINGKSVPMKFTRSAVVDRLVELLSEL